MIGRVYGLIVKELIHLRRDWWLPAFMVFGGVIELMLIGWATSRPITNLPLMVLDQDVSESSREVVTRLVNMETFAFESLATDYQTIQEALDRGNINAAVVIPPDFSKDLASGIGQPQLMVLLNGAESVAARTALRAVQGLASTINLELAVERAGLDPEWLERFTPRVRVWFNEELSEAYYSVPAEMALMLEFTVLIFAALSFARERELGTLEQLLVMPFSSLDIITGKALPAVLIAFFDFVLMLILVQLLFRIPVRGSVPLLLIIALGYLFVELGKGLVISVRSRTQHQAFMLVMLIGMVDFMFTGYAIPVEAMPQALQWIANLVPAYHWLSIARGIMLKGAGIEEIWPHVLALIGLGILIGGFSLRYLRRALS
jgi:ABC-2 type transport system permease protein